VFLTIYLEPDMTNALLLGRVWRADAGASGGPSVVTVRDDEVIDITSKEAPTVRDICELDDPAGYVADADGEVLGTLNDILAAPVGDEAMTHILAPCDLQAVKACGVTFAGSMVERVIEERAAGDPSAAQAIRARIGALIGESLKDITPGSDDAMAVKQALIQEGLWSQYLEVGIGPDAEVFSKAQVLSSVGHGAKVGLHPSSKWNNPEPEVVLTVSSNGRIVGATLGNDVNLRDIEGRSALLLSKAKDNNASCAIGPFIRLFDGDFTLDDVRNQTLTLHVEGPDGFVMHGHSDMAQISRDPADLVRQTLGAHHQYPDGIMLFLGTLFAPTQDRDPDSAPGDGFTHKLGDVVTISSLDLGALTNTVDLSTNCPPWTFGTRALMANLAQRGLL
jgi:fumarylacetoacetate (FAA) hydrolase family protein